MRGVAREAGVAMETVYAGFGSKRQLLAAVMDVAVVGDDLPIPLAQRDFALELGVGTRKERVAKAAGMSAAISARTWDLVQALIQGSATDTELARRRADLDERRRREITRYFEQVASRPATLEQLDEVWLLTSAEVFHMLVHRSGWTPEQHEQWLADRLMGITSDAPMAHPGNARTPHERSRHENRTLDPGRHAHDGHRPQRAPARLHPRVRRS